MRDINMLTAIVESNIESLIENPMDIGNWDGYIVDRDGDIVHEMAITEEEYEFLRNKNISVEVTVTIE